MGGSNQSKSAYNQARAQQNWEQAQYLKMNKPTGVISGLNKEFSTPGQNLVGLGTDIYSRGPTNYLNPQTQNLVNQNQNKALASIGDYTDAAKRQAASGISSEYSNLQDQLNQNRVSQGGYMPGFGASSEDLARNKAQQIADSAANPDMQAAQLYNTQYNNNASNAMQLGGLGLQGTNLGLQEQGLGLSGATTGANLSTIPFQSHLQALGLTECDVNNLLGLQGKIGANIASPFQQITGGLSALGSAGAGFGTALMGLGSV